LHVRSRPQKSLPVHGDFRDRRPVGCDPSDWPRPTDRPQVTLILRLVAQMKRQASWKQGAMIGVPASTTSTEHPFPSNVPNPGEYISYRSQWLRLCFLFTGFILRALRANSFALETASRVFFGSFANTRS